MSPSEGEVMADRQREARILAPVKQETAPLRRRITTVLREAIESGASWRPARASSRRTCAAS